MSMINRREFAIGTVAVLGAPGVAKAEGIPATVDRPVTISFYNYNLATAGLGGDATRELIAEFVAANPNVKVDGIGVTSGQINSRVQADISVGRRPDVAQLGFGDLEFNVRNFGIRALTDVVPESEFREHTKGMVPNGVELARLEGKIYGLAYTFSTPVLFYNASLFRNAGLDPDQPPKTFAQVKAAAEKLHASTGKGGFYTTVFDFDWLFQGLALSNGGRVLSEDRKRLTFGEAPVVEVVAYLQNLAKSGAFPNVREAEIQDVMGAGNLGMLLTTSAYQRFLINAAQGKWELRAAPMPSFDNKPTHPTNSGSALFLMSEDPLKQRASWELMKHMTSKRGYTIITSKIGYLPLRPEIVDDPQYLGDWVKENPMVRPNLEQLTRLAPWQSLPGPNYRQILKIMLTAIGQCIYSTDDVGDVMRDAQTRATALMPRA